MLATLSDTDPDVEKIQIEGLRGIPIWRKLLIVSELSMATRQFALAGLRQRFPSAGLAELNRRLGTLCLGPELAARVYGPEPGAPTTL